MSSFWKLGFVFVVLANPLRHKIAAVPGLAVVALLLSGMISPAYAQVYSQIFTPSGTNSYVLFHGDPAYTVQNVDGPVPAMAPVATPAGMPTPETERTETRASLRPSRTGAT